MSKRSFDAVFQEITVSLRESVPKKLLRNLSLTIRLKRLGSARRKFWRGFQ